MPISEINPYVKENAGKIQDQSRFEDIEKQLNICSCGTMPNFVNRNNSSSALIDSYC